MTAENRLPRAHLAIIHDRKLADYLLAPEHPFGQAKARFFEGLGFSRGAVGALRRALLEHARVNPVTTSMETAFGTKYVVEGPLDTASGRRVGVRAVWFVESGDDRPQFVTAYPWRGGST